MRNAWEIYIRGNKDEWSPNINKDRTLKMGTHFSIEAGNFSPAYEHSNSQAVYSTIMSVKLFGFSSFKPILPSTMRIFQYS